MHASQLVRYAASRIARLTVLLLVLMSGCRPRSEHGAGASNVTTYAGEAGAVTLSPDQDSLEPASASGPIAVDFPLGTLPPEQRQVAELSTIVLRTEFDTRQMSFLSDLTKLKRLEIGKCHPGHPHHSVVPLLEVLATMPQMEFVRIRDGQISCQAVENYLKGCDHAKLKTLDIVTQELDRSAVEGFQRLTGIEELNAVVSPYEIPLCAVQSLRRAGAGKSLRKLELVPCGAEKNQPIRSFSGDSVPKLVAAISGLTNLDELLVPLRIESPRLLEPLTRMPHLRRVQVEGLHLNREALAMLGRMSHLNDITVESLDFGPECAHLLPWLTVRRIHIEQPVTLTDERAYLLALCPQLESVTWWGSSDMTRHVDDIPRDIPHIEFRELD